MSTPQIGSQVVNPFGAAHMLTYDTAYMRDGLSFLSHELEKVDPKIREPLASTWWPRDMPVRTGGGWQDNVAVINVNYATTGADEDSFFGEQNNNIPSMQADFDKQKWDLFQWAHYLDVPYLQQEKLIQVGRNIEEFLNKGIRLFYDKSVDKNVYKGLTRYGRTGLINSANIYRYAVANNAAGTSSKWKDKTPDEILADVNFIIAYTWQKVEHVTAYMANHILIPTDQYTSLVSRKVGTTGDKSILTFLYDNNIGLKQGHPLVIDPLPLCKGAGTGGTDRMVAYCNDIECVRIDQTVTLRRLPTETANLMFRTPFVSQFSEVQFLEPASGAYGDDI